MKKNLLKLLFIIFISLFIIGCDTEYTDDEIESIKTASYDEGYDAGKSDGHDTGFDEGFDEGHDEGYDEGYNEGYDKGLEVGYDEGYDDTPGEDSNTLFDDIKKSNKKKGDDDQIVYITDSGSKYHTEGCGSLWDSCNEITLEEAKERGYTPCARCNPPE